MATWREIYDVEIPDSSDSLYAAQCVECRGRFAVDEPHAEHEAVRHLTDSLALHQRTHSKAA